MNEQVFKPVENFVNDPFYKYIYKWRIIQIYG